MPVLLSNSKMLQCVKTDPKETQFAISQEVVGCPTRHIWLTPPRSWVKLQFKILFLVSTYLY
ncbi:hypothetical protein Hanom_Chr15g01399761 [Helianthus anomalus]